MNTLPISSQSTLSSSAENIFRTVGARISRTRRIQEKLRLLLIGSSVALAASIYIIGLFWK